MKKTLTILFIALSGITIAAPVHSMAAARSISNTTTETVQYTAKDYVQDELIVLFDGIENAGYGIHDESVMTWVDLVNGIQIPLATNTWEKNCLSINQQFCIAMTNTTIKPIANLGINYVLANGFTVEYVYKRTSFAGSKDSNSFFWGHSAIPTSNNRDVKNINLGLPYLQLWGDSRFPVRYNLYNVNAVDELTTTDYATTLTKFTCTCENTTVSFIRNDMLIGIKNDVSSLNRDVRFFAINGVVNNYINRYYNIIGGNVYCIRIYTRSLNTEEVAYNYQIDKARFN